jgi:hypothetical protein
MANWWKIGFFVTLFAFESARETAVIESNDSAKSVAFKSVGNWVFATGSWARRDQRESSLVANSVKYECDQQKSECLIASVEAYDDYFNTPDVVRLPATFEGDIVTLTNDDAECVNYIVRIDTKLEQAFSTRKRKQSSDKNCDMLEPVIESELKSAADISPSDPGKGHFLPIYWTLRKVFS